jgi:hypothetical protein
MSNLCVYLRICGRPTRLESWSNKRPKLSDLLECFGVPRQASSVKKPPSAFWASCSSEELENVAAFFQTSPSSPDKCFGIRFTAEDCAHAGVELDPGNRGTTGVPFVDGRHVDLRGTPDQFMTLVTRIVSKIWEGQDRVRVFPAHQILGEIAVLARLSGDDIEPEARSRCEQVLAKTPDWIAYSQDCVTIRGKLDDKCEFPVTGVRRLKLRRQDGGRWCPSWLRAVLRRWVG